MSFSRAKLTRFNDHEGKEIKQPGSIVGKSKMGVKPIIKPLPKTPISGTRSNMTKPMSKHRSLSQPCSSTIVSKRVQRPHSGGDEKRLTPTSQKAEKYSVCAEHSDEEEETFESTTLLKLSIEDMSKNDNSAEKSLQSPTCKASSSGIPLRIKPLTSPSIPSNKSSPRTPQTNSNGTPVQTIFHLENENNSISIGKPPNEHQKPMDSVAKRNLEAQFHAKKRRVDQLKKELYLKQKPLIEAYQGLVQIKKKLEAAGKNLPLDELSFFVDTKSPTESGFILGGSGEVTKGSLDPETMKNMQRTIQNIPASLMEICKIVMVKRSLLVDMLENIAGGSVNHDNIRENVESAKMESNILEKKLEDTFKEQDQCVTELINTWQTLLHNCGDYSSFSNQITKLQEQLRHKEKALEKLSAEHEHAQNKINVDSTTYEKSLSELRETMKSMEMELQHEKGTTQETKEKHGLHEQRMKVLKIRIRDLEEKQKDAETKCMDLQKQCRIAQDQLKANEHRWSKEKDDLTTKGKHYKQMLDKLTKDRSYFETRVKTLEELVGEDESKYKDLKSKYDKDVHGAKKQAVENKAEKESMQRMYESIKTQLVQMELRNKQTDNAVHFKHETESINTEVEAELYTELLATRVALKSAEDQIQNYNKEKLRFIDTIQSLQGDVDGGREDMAKTLLKNVDRISDLELQLTNREEDICRQKIDIASLKAEIESLRQCQPTSIVAIEGGSTKKDNDLKLMLLEGKAKLERSLKKTLECEQRVIRYEYEMNRQSKQLYEMENLLKLRDGLISMIKTKKDELQIENDSLNKYATKVRELLIQAKYEAKTRTDLVQELSTNLDSRDRVCHQLEKKVKDLEGSLSTTNKKRFKLQDTIGEMEKELQTTRANYSRLLPDMQSRYETNNINMSSLAITNSNIPEPKSTSTVRGNIIKRSSSTNTFFCNTETNKELAVWMNYYHKKLKCLKHCFKTASRQIFVHKLNKCAKRNSHGKSSRHDAELACSKGHDIFAIAEETSSSLASNKQKENKTNKLNNDRDSKENRGVQNEASSRDIEKHRKNKKLFVPTDILNRFTNLDVENVAKCDPSSDNTISKDVSTKHVRFSESSRKLKIATPNSPRRCISVTKPSHKRLPARPTSPNIHIHATEKRNLLKSDSESTIATHKKHLKGDNMSNSIVEERNKFISHANNISHHLTKHSNREGDEVKEKLKKDVPELSAISLYKGGGSVVWCQPSKEMVINSVLISRDLMANSLNKIQDDLTTSINLLSHNCGPDLNLTEVGDAKLLTNICELRFLYITHLQELKTF